MVEARQRFTTMYRGHHRAIERYVQRRAPEVDIADVVAEVFATAWRRFDDVDADNPLPWLYGVARRVLANELRRRARAGRLTDRVILHLPDPAEDHADTVVARSVFDGVIRQLKDQEREAVMLVAWENLGMRDAAEAAGCRPSTFAMRLHRARQHLRTLLDAADQITPQPDARPRLPNPETRRTETHPPLAEYRGA